MDYETLIEEEGVILFLDFSKAFDKLEHPFTRLALQFFAFGKKLINTISMLHEGITSVVLLQSGTTRRFDSVITKS